jgi:hypothetical protein
MISGRDRRESRELECQTVAANDLGEAVRRALAAAPHHVEQRALRRQSGATANRTDHQTVKDEARPDPISVGEQLQLAE